MTVFGSKVCDINVIRCSAMVGGGGGGRRGHFFFFICFTFLFFFFFSFLHLFIFYFIYLFFIYFLNFFSSFFSSFACQLRAQSCTLMMIIPLTHYDNLATYYFQVRESVNEPHNVQLHVFNL